MVFCVRRSGARIKSTPPVQRGGCRLRRQPALLPFGTGTALRRVAVPSASLAAAAPPGPTAGHDRPHDRPAAASARLPVPSVDGKLALEAALHALGVDVVVDAAPAQVD